MAYKFQIGPAQLSGALTQEGAATIEGAVVGESTISASSTLSGFDLLIEDRQKIGVVSNTDLMTLLPSQINVDGQVSASAGFQGLNLEINSGSNIGVPGTLDVSTFYSTGIHVSGTLSASSDLHVDGAFNLAGNANLNANVTLGNAAADKISFVGEVDSSIAVDTDGAYDIGADQVRLRNIYADLLVGSSLSGALDNSLDHGLGIKPFSYDNSTGGITVEVSGASSLTPDYVVMWDADDKFVNSKLRQNGPGNIEIYDGADLEVLTGSVSASADLEGSRLIIDDGQTIGSLSDNDLITLDTAAITLGTAGDIVTSDGIFSASAGLEVQGGDFGLAVGPAGEFQVDSSNGNVSTEGDVSGSAFFINAGSDAEIAQNWLPDVDNTLDLGSSTQRWSNIYVENVIGAVINLETAEYTSAATIGAEVGFALANFSSADQLDLPAGADGKVVRIKSINDGVVSLSASVAGEEIFDEINGDLIELETKGAAVTCVFEGSSGAGKWYII